MPTIEETIKTLQDMGFSEAQAKKALNKTGWSGIEAAAEWLLSHPDDDGTEEVAGDTTAEGGSLQMSMLLFAFLPA